MDYDVAVIGAGWAGFNASLRAKELGLKVALIEKEDIGGTCLNRGCIPTKTLIQSAKIYSLTRKASQFGIKNSDSKINFREIQARKDKIIRQLRQGMQFMLKDIDFFQGEAQFLSTDTLKIKDKELKAKFILIATGSKPAELADLKFDGKKIISSDEILELKKIPQSLLIIGGGVIGCEFASLFNVLGTQVTIVEKMPQLLPSEDKEIARRLENLFKKKGIKVNTGTDLASFDLKNYEIVLVCVGRVSHAQGLGLDAFTFKTQNGKVVVDEYLKTNIPNIYAAGDCTGKVMLAHFAAYQGRIAAENIANPDSAKKADNNCIPNCIFTDPEIASIGLNEESARNSAKVIGIKKFDFLGLGMARIRDETEGLLKIILDQKSDEILGASIMGAQATELIGILNVAISCRIKSSYLRETIFAHPTLSESITEALR
jgi:dihydrolipoamide dehydrogenase